MKNLKNPNWIALIFLASIIILSSCSKDEEAKTTDEKLYNLAKQTDGYTWYKYSDVLLNKSTGSGHAQPYLRTRYNTEATSQFDSVGKIKTGIVFPEGSVIVKELYGSETSLDLYAVLLKESTNESADSNGWVWAIYKKDGSVVIPSSEKGNGCISCHAQTDHVNYTLMNKYFP
jgi:hypothetical protein